MKFDSSNINNFLKYYMLKSITISKDIDMKCNIYFMPTFTKDINIIFEDGKEIDIHCHISEMNEKIVEAIFEYSIILQRSKKINNIINQI